MKTATFTTILFVLLFSGHAQDILYKKNGAMISCKIREIGVTVIKYKRTDLTNSPVFEVKKEDIYKIRYKNGVVDIIDPYYYKTKRDSINNVAKDTAAYSMLYVVFNSGTSPDVFPLYVNGNFICKMKNPSRLAFKMKFIGTIDVYRMVQDKIGPRANLIVQHGNNYAISIKIVKSNNPDPNKKFLMTVIEGNSEIQGFLENEYNSFMPKQEYDFQIVEH